MATTYTTNARLQKPATSDRQWDVPINANADALDAMSALGNLASTPTETPSTTLRVNVAPGSFVRANGTIANFFGSSAVAVAASATTYLWLTDAGVLASGTGFPTSSHLRLAHVVAGPSAIVQVVDDRVQCSVAGTGLGFVLKAGDVMTGSLTVSTPSTGTALLVADPASRQIGFFGATPASQAAALTLLTTTSAGVASDSIADVGTTFSSSVLNNNFVSLMTKVDALITALKRHGLMGS